MGFGFAVQHWVVQYGVEGDFDNGSFLLAVDAQISITCVYQPPISRTRNRCTILLGHFGRNHPEYFLRGQILSIDQRDLKASHTLYLLFLDEFLDYLLASADQPRTSYLTRTQASVESATSAATLITPPIAPLARRHFQCIHLTTADPGQKGSAWRISFFVYHPSIRRSSLNEGGDKNTYGTDSQQPGLLSSTVLPARTRGSSIAIRISSRLSHAARVSLFALQISDPPVAMFILRLLSLAPLALATVLPREGAVNYNGYKVYRIATNGDADAVLDSLSALSYEQWNFRNTEHVDISIAGDQVDAFKALGLEYSVMHEDLGADIAAESAGVSEVSKRQDGALPSDSWFDSYHSYADHVQYWRDLNAAFPSNSQRFVAGQSYENREIFGLKLFGNNTGTPKPAAIWHGTVHAREWITTTTVEYLAYSIIKGYKAGDSTFTSILNKYDIYILPVVNPDGFVFSQTNDRL